MEGCDNNMEVTIRDIAEKCKVGVSTVSRAINNHPDINPETKKLILSTIEELNYIPNNSARNLKRTESKSLAVLVKGTRNHLFDNLIHRMEKDIIHNKYSFFQHHVEEHEDEVEIALQLIKEKRLRGIVFLGGHFEHDNKRMRQISVPFVLSTMGSTNDLAGTVSTYFSVDDMHESYKVTDFLCKKGHKRIAILAAQKDDTSIGLLRLEGYKKALRDNGIEPDEKLIRFMDSDMQTYSMENGYKVMKELLAEEEDFTAVYAISDMQAIGASKAIFRSGKQIPNDYAVAGFDGVEETYFYEPSITTIKQPVEEIADASIKALFKMIKTKESVPGKVFEGELLVRDSTK
ncbi:MAG: LacI family DNA-binding transcriptional regulator [Suipraeoptans sp.]